MRPPRDFSRAGVMPRQSVPTLAWAGHAISPSVGKLAKLSFLLLLMAWFMMGVQVYLLSVFSLLVSLGGGGRGGGGCGWGSRLSKLVPRCSLVSSARPHAAAPLEPASPESGPRAARDLQQSVAGSGAWDPWCHPTTASREEDKVLVCLVRGYPPTN